MSAAFVSYSQRLRDLARERPDAPALAFHSGADVCRFTFAQYDRAVDRAARALARHGVGPDTAVVIVSPNSPAAVIASSAAWRRGAFVAPTGPRSTGAELAAIVEQAAQVRRSVFVLSDHARPPVGVECRSLEELGDDGDGRVMDARLSYPARAVPSGGTTGRPKLILDRGAWGYEPNANALSMIGAEGVGSALIYSPLYHSVGQTLTHVMMLHGATAHLMERFDPDLAQRVFRDEAIEFFFAVPTHMQRILELPHLDRSAFASVRAMYHSGAYCPPTLKRRWLDFMGPERVWEVFGASEAIGYTRIRGDEWLAHPGSVGRPYHTDVRIQDERRNTLPTGETGIIFMRGHGGAVPTSDRVYMGGELEVAEDGFATVGDMGWLDDDGYLFIADRRTDMIISGGVNIFPAEVETALLKVSGVRSAAVIGVPDEKWGRRVHAVIVPESGSGLSVEALGHALAELIAPLKKPKSYEFRSELPMTEVGKIDRARLGREHLEQAAAGSEGALT